MIEFKYNDYGKEISYKTDEVTKHELMQDFASFLRAIGYDVQGEIVEYNEPDWKNDEED